MTSEKSSPQALRSENDTLRRRLEEAEDTLRAIGSGEVDAFVVSGAQGDQVYTLKGAERPYRILVESMSEAAATLDRDGTILYCNGRLAELLQLPLEKLIGTRLGSFIDPACLHLFTARLEHCTWDRATEEITLLTGAGDAVPVEVSCCAFELPAGDGISMLISDLRQKKRNDEIVASELLARSIIDQAGEAIIVCDPEGRIIRASRLAHDLCGRNPLLGSFDTVFPLQLIDRDVPFSVVAPLRGGLLKNVEVEFKRCDGQLFHLLLNASQMACLQSRIAGCVVTLIDITDRKRTQEALHRFNEELECRVVERTAELAAAIEKLKAETRERLQMVEALREKEQMLVQQSRLAAMGEMINNIAHQWRQPLNALGLAVQQVEMLHEYGELTPEFVRTNSRHCMALIQHMSQTVDDFRDYFKPEKEKVKFNISRIISSTLAIVAGSFKHERVEIVVDCLHDPVVFGYKNDFAQSLLNILNNAKDALRERKIDQPKVCIAVFSEGDRAVVTVADNAGGIPEEIMSRIFEPYFTTKGPQAGTGIGLYMTKNIIETKMGGRLSVRNLPQGAEFRIEV